MKIKCPGCGKILSIPEAAAGKIVKCPCGKQLRAPGAAKAPAAAAKPATSKPAAGKPATAQPAARPAAARPASRPAPPTRSQPAAAAPAVDDDLFGELTDQDLSPVKSVYSPGQKAPAAAGSPSEEGAVKKSKKSVVKIVFGSVLVVLGSVGLIAFFMGVGGGGDDEAGDTVSIRRRSPIGICIGVIITGFGWAAAGLKGSKEEAE